MNVRQSIRYLVAFLLLLTVAAIFVSPLVDIPETILRAKSLAQLAVLALIAMATLLSGFVSPVATVSGLVCHSDCASEPFPALDLILPLLC